MLNKSYIKLFIPILCFILFIISLLFINNILFYLLLFFSCLYIYQNRVDYNSLCIFILAFVSFLIYYFFNSLFCVKIVFVIIGFVYFMNDISFIKKNNFDIYKRVNKLVRSKLLWLGKDKIKEINLNDKIDYEVSKYDLASIRINKRIINYDSLFYILFHFLFIISLYVVSYALFNYVFL